MRSEPNPFKQAPQLLRLVFNANAAGCDALEEMFEDVALAISRSAKADAKKCYTIEILGDAPVLNAVLAHCPNAPDAKEMVEDKDWVAEVQANFPAFRVGRFYLHGAHVTTRPADGSVAIWMDAGAAFGTGEHGTTAGCMLLLDRLARHRQCQNVLDMGAGTGVLAIAAAKLWRDSRALAVDNCRVAVRVSAENCERNRVEKRVKNSYSDGFHSAIVQRNGPYDLVIANILAGPLIAMAPDLLRVTQPGGMILLSGLLNRQESRVLAAYTGRGGVLVDAVRQHGWSALMLRKSH